MNSVLSGFVLFIFFVVCSSIPVPREDSSKDTPRTKDEHFTRSAWQVRSDVLASHLASDDKRQPSKASKKDETNMDESLEENDDDQEKDDHDDGATSDDDNLMDTEPASTTSAEDDASMTEGGASKPIVKLDDPEAKKLRNDEESLEGDDEMKSEKIASFANDLEQSRDDLGSDGNSDVSGSTLNSEEKTASLESDNSGLKGHGANFKDSEGNLAVSDGGKLDYEGDDGVEPEDDYDESEGADISHQKTSVGVDESDGTIQHKIDAGVTSDGVADASNDGDSESARISHLKTSAGVTSAGGGSSAGIDESDEIDHENAGVTSNGDDESISAGDGKRVANIAGEENSDILSTSKINNADASSSSAASSFVGDLSNNESPSDDADDDFASDTDNGTSITSEPDASNYVTQSESASNLNSNVNPSSNSESANADGSAGVSNTEKTSSVDGNTDSQDQATNFNGGSTGSSLSNFGSKSSSSSVEEDTSEYDDDDDSSLDYEDNPKSGAGYSHGEGNDVPSNANSATASNTAGIHNSASESTDSETTHASPVTSNSENAVASNSGGIDNSPSESARNLDGTSNSVVGNTIASPATNNPDGIDNSASESTSDYDDYSDSVNDTTTNYPGISSSDSADINVGDGVKDTGSTSNSYGAVDDLDYSDSEGSDNFHGSSNSKSKNTGISDNGNTLDDEGSKHFGTDSHNLEKSASTNFRNEESSNEPVSSVNEKHENKAENEADALDNDAPKPEAFTSPEKPTPSLTSEGRAESAERGNQALENKVSVSYETPTEENDNVDEDEAMNPTNDRSSSQAVGSAAQTAHNQAVISAVGSGTAIQPGSIKPKETPASTERPTQSHDSEDDDYFDKNDQEDDDEDESENQPNPTPSDGDSVSSDITPSPDITPSTAPISPDSTTSSPESLLSDKTMSLEDSNPGAPETDSQLTENPTTSSDDVSSSDGEMPTGEQSPSSEVSSTLDTEDTSSNQMISSYSPESIPEDNTSPLDMTSASDGSPSATPDSTKPQDNSENSSGADVEVSESEPNVVSNDMNDNADDDDNDDDDDDDADDGDDNDDDGMDGEALYGKLHRHPLDVRLIDDIDARFDDAEQRSHIRAHHRKRHLGRVTHPKHFIGLSPSGGAMGYGGYGRGVPGIGPYGFVGTNVPGFPAGYPLGTKWKMTDHGYVLDHSGFQLPISPHSACTCGPMGCICHPLSLKAAQGKRRDKATRKDNASTKSDEKEQTGTKRETICKCGALGCGCAPLPGEETEAKRDDVPATSPHPVDVAIGWPFGYGPSFGWGPGPGVGPLKPLCPVGKRDGTKKTGSKSHKRCIDSYTPNMANSFAAEPFMGWPFGLHSNIGFGWPFSGCSGNGCNLGGQTYINNSGR